jgi:hypothetical protein
MNSLQITVPRPGPVSPTLKAPFGPVPFSPFEAVPALVVEAGAVEVEAGAVEVEAGTVVVEAGTFDVVVDIAGVLVATEVAESIAALLITAP